MAQMAHPHKSLFLAFGLCLPVYTNDQESMFSLIKAQVPKYPLSPEGEMRLPLILIPKAVWDRVLPRMIDSEVVSSIPE